MDLPILYEDTDIVAVNKPARLLTHYAPPKLGEGKKDGRTKEATAEEWFKEKYPSADGGYVHRLDRDTSGVLVFAKTAAAREFLRRAFTDRAVKKTYLAFVYGVPPTEGRSASGGKERIGVIDFDIGRSRKDFRLRSAQPKAKGRLREALTRYEVVGVSGDCALLLVKPETGRTHQIRVHLKAIHHPVVGDALYAPNRSAALGVDRLGLHAYSLDLPTPSGGRALITAPIPRDLTPALARFLGTGARFAAAEGA